MPFVKGHKSPLKGKKGYDRVDGKGMRDKTRPREGATTAKPLSKEMMDAVVAALKAEGKTVPQFLRERGWHFTTGKVRKNGIAKKGWRHRYRTENTTVVDDRRALRVELEDISLRALKYDRGKEHNHCPMLNVSKDLL
jgi:hypothetical protein